MRGELARWLLGLLAISAAGASVPLRAQEAAEPRIVAVGDVHGSPGAFSRLLRAAELIDDSGAWIGGDAILVQTGDLTDRGPGVREVLDIMRDLEQSAEANGGQVVSLLGNHEIYNLIGYYDYQSTPLPIFTEIASSFADEESEKTRRKAYKRWASWARRYKSCAGSGEDDWMARNPLGFVEYQEALSPRGEYGQWLREKNVAAKVGETLFLHGGLSPELAGRGIRSVDAINERAAAELAQYDRDLKWLVGSGVVPNHPTLAELHCAVAFERHRIRRDSGEAAIDRRRRLEEIQSRLPALETWMLLDPSGPVWFRGYASWSDEEAEAQLASVLESFGGKRVVVGHTPQLGKVVPRFEGRVFLIDTAMAYPELKGRAMALEIRGDAISTISQAGRVPLDETSPSELPALIEEPAALPARAPEGETSANEGDTKPEASLRTRSRSTGTEPGSQRLLDGLAAGHEPAARGVPVNSGSSPAERVRAASTQLEARGPDPERTADGTDASGSLQVWLAEDGSTLPFVDHSAILDFLETARVVEKEAIGQGVTQAEKLVLEKDGIRAHAAFHDVDEAEQRRQEKGRILLNFRDSYLNNLAAYELGRLLAISNIAPTTVRKIGSRKGSIQLWIEKTIDETERREHAGVEELSAHLRRRIADMWVFDNLINNVDRNQGNMLHDSRGEFWMIDHTRSFNAASKLPEPQRIRRCSRGLLAAIRSLDEEETRERLEPYLRKFEVKALWARRAALLEFLDERIATLGEDAVLFSYETSDDPVTVYYEEDEVPARPLPR